MKKAINTILFGGPGAANAFGDVGLFLTRVSFGIFMLVFHGWGKLVQPPASEGDNWGFGPTEGFIGATESMGFPLPTLFAWGATLAETLFAALLIVGLFTRPAALILVFNMGVAAFVANADAPWYVPQSVAGKEAAMVYLVPYLLFVFTGGGRLSLDAVLRRRG